MVLVNISYPIYCVTFFLQDIPAYEFKLDENERDRTLKGKIHPSFLTSLWINGGGVWGRSFLATFSSQRPCDSRKTRATLFCISNGKIHHNVFKVKAIEIARSIFK